MKLGKLLKHIDGDISVTICEKVTGGYKDYYTCEKVVFISSELYHRKVESISPRTYSYTQRETVMILMITLKEEKII